MYDTIPFRRVSLTAAGSQRREQRTRNLFGLEEFLIDGSVVSKYLSRAEFQTHLFCPRDPLRSCVFLCLLDTAHHLSPSLQHRFPLQRAVAVTRVAGKTDVPEFLPLLKANGNVCYALNHEHCP